VEQFKKMIGGVLVASKSKNLHGFYREELEKRGFKDVYVTEVDKDGLNSIIREMKPKMLIMDSVFYQCSTAYMLIDLVKLFPKLNIVIVSMETFPDDKAMYFIINGAKSYVNWLEGPEEFNFGLNEVRDGREFISSGPSSQFT
jgi:DNA-binding NarL/FixJ family response regulator